MNKKRSIFWFLAGMISVSVCAGLQPAWAEESTESEDASRVSRAVWISPATEHAPWLDNRPNMPQMAVPQILAVGGDIALMRLPDGRMVAADAQLNALGDVWMPSSVKWFGIDGQSRILVYDGVHLQLAQSYREASEEAGYRDILSIANTAFIDSGSSVVAYVDGSRLMLANLDSGMTRDVTLTDFFADARVERMRPENVAADEAVKLSKNKKAIKALEKLEADAAAAAAESALQPFEVAGLWVRPDDKVVVRVRRLLNERTFVSADGGKSWQQILDAPKTLVHQGNWIWDGHDLVLGEDGQSFVKIEGTAVSLPDRWVMAHSPEMGKVLPEDWMHKANPVKSAQSETDGNSVEAETQASETQASEAIVNVGTIPIWTASESHDLYRPVNGIYQPKHDRTGIQMGFYRNASCPGQMATCDAGIRNAPDAWQMTPEGRLENQKLPDNCVPRYLDSERGLGLLICDATEGEVGIYVKTADSDWVYETKMPAEIADGIQIAGSDDGTIAVMGQCHNEVIASADSETETPETTVWMCPVAVRQPMAVSQPDAWRLERMVNTSAVSVISGGRLLAIQSDSPGAAFQQMSLLAPTSSETLVDRFDPSLYEGVVLTNDGCLALSDGTVPPETLKKGGENVQLLSVSGGFAGMDCVASKAVMDAEIAAANEEEAPVGDARYGLRLGAAGFFASGDVQTWAMRVEGLIPIYGGQYEVGLLYRMGGGNKSSAMGHLGIVSVRWRYDGLQLFDFAVGAGIGYGSMCGYEKERVSEEEEEETAQNVKKKGYEACSTLSIRYMVSAIAAYKFAKQWKLYIAAELLGGSEWGFDIGGGIEVRF